jgi:hypothetical protein
MHEEESSEEKYVQDELTEVNYEVAWGEKACM